MRLYRTWAPLLLNVKREYGGYIAHLEEEGERLRPLEARFKSLEDDFAEKVLHIRQEAEVRAGIGVTDIAV